MTNPRESPNPNNYETIFDLATQIGDEKFYNNLLKIEKEFAQIKPNDNQYIVTSQDTMENYTYAILDNNKVRLIYKIDDIYNHKIVIVHHFDKIKNEKYSKIQKNDKVIVEELDDYDYDLAIRYIEGYFDGMNQLSKEVDEQIKAELDRHNETMEKLNKQNLELVGYVTSLLDELEEEKQSKKKWYHKILFWRW